MSTPSTEWHITTFAQIPPGGYFAVKIAGLGNVVYRRFSYAAGGKCQTMRCYDSAHHDPTFGPETVVRRIDSEEEALAQVSLNRNGVRLLLRTWAKEASQAELASFLERLINHCPAHALGAFRDDTQAGPDGPLKTQFSSHI